MRAKWTIAVHREAKKELHRLPKVLLERALAEIRALAHNPFPAGCSKLESYDSLYRVRVGE